MEPIGASADWRWHGYETSWVEVGGRRVQSVSGGGHWGGGVFIHAEDQARIGLLTLRTASGTGAGSCRRAGWRSAAPPARSSGLRAAVVAEHRPQRWPAASAADSFSRGRRQLHLGRPEAGTVAVLRWIDPARLDGFMAAVAAAAG